MLIVIRTLAIKLVFLPYPLLIFRAARITPIQSFVVDDRLGASDHDHDKTEIITSNTSETLVPKFRRSRLFLAGA
jgi:hypothetical protein